jgi:hypothetical protein
MRGLAAAFSGEVRTELGADPPSFSHDATSASEGSASDLLVERSTSTLGVDARGPSECGIGVGATMLATRAAFGSPEACAVTTGADLAGILFLVPCRPDAVSGSEASARSGTKYGASCPRQWRRVFRHSRHPVAR